MMDTNKKTPRFHAELIKAWADGAAIQFLGYDKKWAAIEKPMWSPHTQYRVKPEPKRYRVALLSSGVPIVVRTDHYAKYWASNVSFVRWLADWVEYED